MSVESAPAGGEASKLAPLNERRTQMIFGAALEVFAEHGLAHTRLADVAARAGVSLETLLVRFGDRDEVALQAIKWVAGRIRIDPEILTEVEESTALRLERLILAVIAQASMSEGLIILRMILAEGWRNADLARAYDEGIRQPTLELVRAFAERLSERGKIHQEDEDGLVAAFEGFVRGELEPALLGLAPSPDERLIRRRARASARRLLRAFRTSAKSAAIAAN